MYGQFLKLLTVAGVWTTFGVASIFFNFWHKTDDLGSCTDNFRSRQNWHASQTEDLSSSTDNFRTLDNKLKTSAGVRTIFGPPQIFDTKLKTLAGQRTIFGEGKKVSVQLLTSAVLWTPSWRFLPVSNKLKTLAGGRTIFRLQILSWVSRYPMWSMIW